LIDIGETSFDLLQFFVPYSLQYFKVIVYKREYPQRLCIIKNRDLLNNKILVAELRLEGDGRRG